MRNAIAQLLISVIAMLFDAKQAKQNYLIDTIISYKDVKKLMINKLKLKDYKILPYIVNFIQFLIFF